MKAEARHILVQDEGFCKELLQQILRGDSDFAEMAEEFSECPSGQQGGNLGEFGPGMMVPEFDSVVFSAEIGVPQGPVKTQFGYHIIEVTSRDDG